MEKWNEISILTTTNGIDIVGGLLTTNGVRGHIIEDAQDFDEFLQKTVIHWDYIDDDLLEKKHAPTKLTFYLADNMQGVETLNQIKRDLIELPNLNSSVDLGSLELQTSFVQEEDWANEWKKYYHPTKVGERLTVVPCWEEYNKAPDEVTVLLNPGMAFGSGTHETTQLCLQLLESHVTNTTDMLDIGTGSGILAISALLLGAKTATGVDIDELSVKVAHENATLNNVGDKIQLHCGDLVDKIDDKYDIVCANIVADVIIRLAETVRQYMKQDGVLIVSGIIEERADEVTNVLNSEGFTVVNSANKNGWVAMQLK